MSSELDKLRQRVEDLERQVAKHDAKLLLDRKRPPPFGSGYSTTGPYGPWMFSTWTSPDTRPT